MACLRSSMRRGSKVQELYDACTMVFSGEWEEEEEEGASISLEDNEEIRWLRDILGRMESADVGIDGSDDDDNAAVAAAGAAGCKGMLSGRKVEEITYVHIYECEEFSIGVFCFPAGAKMPLHDHPEMVVLSKVLYGSVKVRAYDWVVPPLDPNARKCGLASVVVDDRVLGPKSPASVLFPASGGNMHAFTALTPCAILDVLSPPYSDDEGRPSTYFAEVPIPSLSGYAILEERDVPEDLVVVGAPYLGPEIVVVDDDGDYF